jgi:hypothetical protein
LKYNKITYFFSEPESETITNQRAGTDIKRAFLMKQGKKGLYAGMLVTILIVGTVKLVLLALCFSSRGQISSYSQGIQ